MKKIISLISICALLLIIGGCSSESTTSSADQNKTHKIFNSVEDLQSKFNAASKKYNLNFSINNTDIKPGKVQDVFQCMFNNYIGLNCAINKSDKSVRSVLMIAHGTDGSSQTAVQTLMTIGTLIGTADPSLSLDDIKGIINDLGLTQRNLIGLKKTVTRNNIIYGIDISQEIGISFNISNANDK